ncbi:MAG: hypothetical protein B7Z55_17465, partial [Planctomycetales bacterium 12-60-4]
MFNGKDLTGWRNDGHWSVENGSLVSRLPKGELKDSSFLTTERTDYRDFHVRAVVKINAGGDSGLFFRFGDQGDASIQAQIMAAPANVGSLLRHATVVVPSARLVPPDEWFTLEVIAEGSRVVVLVDGQETVSWIDPSGTTFAGPIGIESAYPGTE